MGELLPKGDGPISQGTLAYFEERLWNRLYSLIITEFKQQRDLGLTQAKMAKRLGKYPEQISRWLSGPRPFTFRTVSTLLLAISNSELKIGIQPLAEQEHPIKTCPFCNGEGVLDVMITGDVEQHYIRCRSCAAEGPWGKHPTTAISGWNRRGSFCGAFSHLDAVPRRPRIS